MEIWQFFQDRQGSWLWRRVDENGYTVTQAARPFQTRNDCIADAMGHGYLDRPYFRLPEARYPWPARWAEY